MTPEPQQLAHAEPVLLVEDDPGVRETLTDILTDVGYEVVGCASAADAERISGVFGLALVDIKLPDGNGVEVARSLRRRQPDLDLIFVTANASIDSAIDAVGLQAVRYLQKPVHPRHLLPLMAEVLERRSLQQEAARQARRVRTMHDFLHQLIRTRDLEQTATVGAKSICLAMRAQGAALTLCTARVRDSYVAGTLTNATRELASDAQRVSELAWDTPSDEFKPLADGVLVRCIRTTDDMPLACIFVEGVRAIDDEELATLMSDQLAVALQQSGFHAELHAAYKQLSDTHRTLVEAEKQSAVGRLAAGIAHEIGTPLNIISGRAELMLARAGDDVRLAKGLKTIHGQIDRIAGLVRQLLDFSRAEQDEKMPIRLSAVLAETLPLVETRSMKRRSAIANNVEGAPADLPVRASFHQLQQVVLNLVLNAMDAGCDTIALDVAASRDDKRLTLTVTDDGPGIPVDKLEQVFEPFFTTKPRGEGTGLGLAVVRGIIRDHGGEIYAELPDGGGTRFVVSLPTA